MEIFGLFYKEVFRNEKNGYSGFFILTDEGKIFCAGKIQKITEQLPLILTGQMLIDEKGRNRFEFTSYNFNDTDKSNEIAFLASMKIDGLTIKKAKEFVDYFNYGIFYEVKQYSRKKDFVNRCPQKLQKFAALIYTKVTRALKLKNLFLEIIKAGGDYSNVTQLLDKYGHNAKTILEKDPYVIGYYANLPFLACEHIAIKNNIGKYNKSRAKGILYFAMNLAEKQGDSYIDKNELKKICSILQKNSLIGITPFEYIWAIAILDETFYVNNNKISWAKIKVAEESLAENIIRLIRSGKKLDISKDEIKEIKRLENICHVKLSDSQKKAMNALKTSGIKVITGGPGSGKTTLTNIIIKYCEDNFPDRGIVLCAPTGCAAQNMSIKTEHISETIHRTLGLKPFGKKNRTIVTKKRTEKIYIIDEGSMMDLEIADILFDSIPNDSIVLIVGDVNQLPSVQVGSVLQDLIEAGIETYELEGSFRQASGSSIINNAYKVKNGETDLEINNKDFTILHTNTDEDVIKTCLAYVAIEPECQILCPTKKYNVGSKEISELIQNQRLNTDKTIDSTKKKKYGNTTFYVGDKIIMTNNNYKTGYYNGDPGIITNIDAQGIEIDFYGRKILYITNQELMDVSLSYALTVHKSQGAEYKNIIIVLTKQAINMMNRNLLYTAITRAKENVIIIENGELLKTAINNIPKRRNSGLKELLINQSIFAGAEEITTKVNIINNSTPNSLDNTIAEKTNIQINSSELKAS